MMSLSRWRVKVFDLTRRDWLGEDKILTPF
jgi:hypothetical protein